MEGPLFLLQIVRADTGETARLVGPDPGATLRAALVNLGVDDAYIPRVLARLPGGGTLERDLVEIFTKHILARPELVDTIVAAVEARPVGIFRTRVQVGRQVREALRSAQAGLALAVNAGITDALMGLKQETASIIYKPPL